MSDEEKTCETLATKTGEKLQPISQTARICNIRLHRRRQRVSYKDVT